MIADVTGGLDAFERPLRPGLPLSARPGLVGTLGVIARDRDDGAVLALGTSHVLRPDAAGAAVWQPGPCRRPGCECNRVGITWRDHCDVVSCGGHRYFLDCAVVRLDADIPWDPTIAGQRIAGVGTARRGMRVWKLGAGSGRTAGIVVEDRHEEPAQLAGGCRPVPNQLLVQPLAGHGSQRFSSVGDSGALLLDEDQRAVGLLWAASPSGYALACPVEPVLEALAIELETGP